MLYSVLKLRRKNQKLYNREFNSKYEGKIMKNLEKLNQKESYQVCSYKDFFNIFMDEAIRDGALYPGYNFSNVAWNLVFCMKQYITPSDLERDYEIECMQLKESYNKIVKCINEIKTTTPEDILSQGENRFILSIDTFLSNILEATNTLNIISNTPVEYESILEVSICHDCITKTYDIINTDVSILGNDSN